MTLLLMPHELYRINATGEVITHCHQLLAAGRPLHGPPCEPCETFRKAVATAEFDQVVGEEERPL